jgi:hypothetical protein
MNSSFSHLEMINQPKLPLELMEHIFSYLEIDEVFRFILTCKDYKLIYKAQEVIIKQILNGWIYENDALFENVVKQFPRYIGDLDDTDYDSPNSLWDDLIVHKDPGDAEDFEFGVEE